MRPLHYASAAGYLHPNEPSITETLCAEGGPGQGLKLVAAENVGVKSDSNVSMSPLSLQGIAKGVGLHPPGSPGKTADRMAQALRYC